MPKWRKTRELAVPSIVRHNPYERVLAYGRRIHKEVAGEDSDVRLTEAQRYAGVVKVLGCDPAIVAARIIDLCLMKNSKWSTDPYTLFKMTEALHHMITASPDIKRAKAGAEDNQFELDFQWQADGNAGMVQ